MAARRRTPAQIAASKRNLEKARAAKKKKADLGNNWTMEDRTATLPGGSRYSTLKPKKSSPKKKKPAKDPKRFTKALAKTRKDSATARAKYGDYFWPAPGKKARSERVGGRVWAANEAARGGISEATRKKLFAKGSRTRVSGRTGEVFTQTRRQAIMGIRIPVGTKARKRRKGK